LLKRYDKLWVFGDSFLTPDICVSPSDSFWGLAATHIEIPTVLNCSRPVNSFDSVCQLLVGLQQQINWGTDLVLIGIPPLERITVFDDHKDTAYNGHQFSTQTWESTQFDIECHRGLIGLQNYGNDKQMIIHNDRSWLETQALRTVFFLTTWLDSICANYVLLNLSKDFDENNIWGPSNFVLSYCKNHQNCVLFKNTYHGINLDINKPADFDQYGWNGHHGPEGNKYFFEKSLMPKLKELNLC
jgi:hypothetical protein